MYIWISSSCSYSFNISCECLNRLIHLFTHFFYRTCDHDYFPLIIVPISSPSTTRLILPSSEIENTISDMSLSMQRDEAVEYITPNHSLSISIYDKRSYFLTSLLIFV